MLLLQFCSYVTVIVHGKVSRPVHMMQLVVHIPFQSHWFVNYMYVFGFSTITQKNLMPQITL